MNIFILDKDPRKCAEYLCNVHLNKMLVEHSQMLANCYSKESLLDAPKTQKGNVRKYSYYNHPASIWVRQSLENFQWLWYYSQCIIDERKFRGFNNHFCETFINWIPYRRPDNIDNQTLMTKFVSCMPDQYKQEDVVEAYRAYYIGEKQYNKAGKFMLKYTNRDIPEFLKGKVNG